MEGDPAEVGLWSRDRRKILHGGLGLVGLVVGTQGVRSSAAAAVVEAAPQHILEPAEVVTLEGIGEALVPGSRQAGLASYVDSQLRASSGDCLLAARLIGVAAPFKAFYETILRAIERSCAISNDGRRFHEIDEPRRAAFLSSMHQGGVPGWQGPPTPLVYFVLRNDAVDVRYGTVAGFADLGVPYMPHIAPDRRW